MGTHIVFKIVRSRGGRIVIIFLCAFLGIGVLRSVYSLSQKKSILWQQQGTLTTLKAQNRQLTSQLSEATSSAFVERAARDKLGLVKEGEKVVIMETLQASANTQGNVQPLPSWRQWWGLFF